MNLLKNKHEKKMDEGRKAFTEKDYEKAFTIFLGLAEGGHPQAQCNLGLMYFRGNHVEEDELIAEYWLKTSYENGEPKAAANLGSLYEEKHQNYEQALHWYSIAAENGLDAGQNSLGLLHDRGLGVPENKEEAIRLYTLAAQQNCSEAMINLGALLYSQEKYSDAFPWLKKAAELGEDVAQYNVATMYINGHGVEESMQKAMPYLMESAKQDNPKALFLLGEVFYDGYGVEPDEERGLYFMHLAYELGHPDATLFLGKVFENTEPTKAAYFYNMARNRGISGLEELLDILYEKLPEEEIERLKGILPKPIRYKI